MEQNHAIAGSPAESLSAGTIIDGRYRLASAVVQHTTNAIYTALDEQSRQRVRVRITPQSPDLALLHIKHPAIPAVLSTGRIGHWYYVVTEWFDGAPLELPDTSTASAPNTSLSIAEQRAWATRAMDMLDVLEFIQRTSGRAHGNISLSSFWEGRDGRLRFIDASAPDGPLGPEGIPFASPERLRGMPRDERSDVYQLACVLYGLIFGAPPYGLDLVEARSGHLLSRLPELTADANRIMPALFAVLRTALEKQSHHRFAGSAGMRAAFGVALADIDHAARDASTYAASNETVIKSPAELLFPTGTLESAPVRAAKPRRNAEAARSENIEPSTPTPASWSSREEHVDRGSRNWLVALAAFVVFGLSATAVLWVALLGALAVIASQSQNPLTAQLEEPSADVHSTSSIAPFATEPGPLAPGPLAPGAVLHAPTLTLQSSTAPVDFTANDWKRPTVRASFPQFLELVRQHPGLVKLTGHTDNRGPALVNYQIGLGRAWATQRLLVISGIASPKLPIDSRGEAEPIGDNATPAGRAANRRVTAEFLAPGTPDSSAMPNSSDATH